VQQGGAFRKAFGHKNPKAGGLVFYMALQISQQIEVAGRAPSIDSGPKFSRTMDGQTAATCRTTPFHYQSPIPNLLLSD